MYKLKLSSRIITILFAAFSQFSSLAQITVNNTLYTTTQLVNTVLVPVGSGTTISGVNFRGVYGASSKYQVGYFSTAGPTLTGMGFTSGVYLSTGNTSSVPLTLGTNPGSVAQMSTGYVSGTAGEIRSSNPLAGQDADAQVLISPYNYYNAAILEFDFIPVTSSVSFRYIFASEEYNDESGSAFAINYNCSSYNDKFAFLISGPGIAGGQGYISDAKNIARLPNGSEVGINSVNDGIVGSSGGAPSAGLCTAENPGWTVGTPTPEFLGFINGTQYNGNTRILTASQTGLTPGVTYHIRLLIGDANDAAYDSGVFIEAGSFTTEFANAGVNQSICSNSATLNALSPTIGTWTLISGTGTISNASSASSGVTGLSAGSNVFQWSNGTVSSTVTITVGSAPTVSSAGSNSISCSALTATLTGTSVGSTMVWNGGALVNAANPANVSAAGTYTVTATNPANGCTATSTVIVSGSTTAPTVSSVSSNSISCSTATATLTGTSAGATLVWNGGALVNAANPANVSAAGTYTVTATNPANGCTATSTVIVLSDTIAPTVTAVSSGSITCSVPSVSLTGTSAGSTLVWNGGSLVNATNPSTVSSSGTYTVTATDPANGCTASASVTVNSSGTLPNISIATPMVITCTTPSLTLNGSSTSPGVGYQWTGGPATASYTVTAAATYTLTITDLLTGCSSQQTVNVSSNTTPPAVSAGPPLALGCSPSSGIISVSSTTTGATYSWAGVGITVGAFTDTPSVNAAGTYTVTVTDPANGCTSTTSVLVTSNTNPPTVTAGQALILNCGISSGTISATSTSAGVLYNWTGVGISAGATTASPTVTAAGTYTVVVTDPANGCTASANVSVSSNPGPTANAGTDATINAGISATLTASGGGSYLWSTGATTNTISVSPTVTTDYCVTVTDTTGCADTACVRISVDLECGELFVPNAFSPNNDQSNDVFRVKINPVCVKEMLLVVYDRWGEKMIEITDPSVSWDGSYQGKTLDNAVFVYYLSITLINSTEVIKKSGNVSLLK